MLLSQEYVFFLEMRLASTPVVGAIAMGTINYATESEGVGRGLVTNCVDLHTQTGVQRWTVGSDLGEHPDQVEFNRAAMVQIVETINRWAA